MQYRTEIVQLRHYPRTEDVKGAIKTAGQRTGLFFTWSNTNSGEYLVLSGLLGEGLRVGSEDYDLSTGQVRLNFPTYIPRMLRSRFIRNFMHTAREYGIHPIPY